MDKNHTILDHLKYYISLTQKAKIELKNGNKELHDKFFNKAEEHLKSIGWEAFVMKDR